MGGDRLSREYILAALAFSRPSGELSLRRQRLRLHKEIPLMLTLRQARRLETVPAVDVLVAGGGPAGFSAGFAAARLGAKTLIVEQCNCLGGIATAGEHAHICLYSAWASARRVVGGPIWEAAGRVAETGYGVRTNGDADFEIEGLKLALDRLAEECGVGVLYYSFVADTEL